MMRSFIFAPNRGLMTESWQDRIIKAERLAFFMILSCDDSVSRRRRWLIWVHCVLDLGHPVP
jgi:hypothetical protein